MADERDRKPDGDVATGGDTTRGNHPDGMTEHANKVQVAVEAFVQQHSNGEQPDLSQFVLDYPATMRAEILSQCREFLSFDGLLGHQEWDEAPATDSGGEASGDGRMFGDFLIQEELGRGGMGIVYLAQQRSLNRRVALKVMASGLTLSKRHVERFRREAAATAKLRHPAIVSVHSLTEVDGTFALAMDYVAGRNLADIVDDLRLANGIDDPAHPSSEGVSNGKLGVAPEKGYVAECAMLAAQVASALATAHHNQVVHRDLKPRNLMLDDRRQARLLDFGLAKSLDTTSASLSMSGEITGTAHYMSPEQTLAKRVDIDHRADIWSLGVILYELLTLHRPFDGKNLQQIVYEICFKEPVPLQKRNPKVPRDLCTIVNKALEKDPQNRYQTAAEFEADLQRFLRWEPVHAKPAPAWTRAAKFLRRHRTETVIATTALVVTTVLLSGYWYRTSRNHELADHLLASAQQHADARQFSQAIARTNDALELRNNETTRTRLDLYHAESKRIEMGAAWKVAESKRLLEHDRERALLLALEADDLHASAKTRSAVLDALGSGWSMRTLPSPEDKRVLVARWSPDGKQIVTAGFPGSLLHFDDYGQRDALALHGHNTTAPVVDAAFAGNDRIVSVSPDRTMRLWNPQADGEPEIIDLPGQAAAMYASANGARAMVITYGSTKGPFLAQVWDTRTAEPVGNAIEHGSFILAGALSPDGNYAATCSGAYNTTRLSRVATGEQIAELEGLEANRAVRVLAFGNRSELLAIGTNSGAIHIYDAETGALRGTGRHPGAITSLAFDSRDDRLLSASREGTARLWRLKPHEGSGRIDLHELGSLNGHRGPVRTIAFDASDRLAITGTGMPDGKLRVFDVGSGPTPTGDAIHRYEVGAQIDRCEFSVDGHRVLAIAGGRAIVWNFGTGRGVVTLRQNGTVPAACFANEGRRIVTAGDDERLRLWHTRDGRQIWRSPPLGNPLLAVDIDARSERVACSMVDGVVAMHRLRDGAQLFTLRGHDGKATVVRFVGDGSRLLTAGAQADGARAPSTGRIVLWNTNDQSALLQFDRPHAIASADIREDGLLATAERGESQVRLWQLSDSDAQPQAAGTIGATDGPALRHVAFSPDGQRVLVAYHDRTARLYSLQGKQLATFQSNSLVRAATFSPDGTLVLTCGTGRTGGAQLWRTADGTEVLHFEGHRGSVEWGTFSSTGEWIATCSRDHTTCIWPTDPVAAARRLPLSRPTTHAPDPGAATRPR